jgi:hypothetical protein
MSWRKIDAPDLSRGFLIYVGVSAGSERKKAKDFAVVFDNVGLFSMTDK